MRALCERNGLAASGAPAAVSYDDSAAVPATMEERSALLRQMAARAPDAANPFRSHKARMHRARLILQARDHRQQEAATAAAAMTVTRFDLASLRPAMPERQTARELADA
jgi:hypothetical protein